MTGRAWQDSAPWHELFEEVAEETGVSLGKVQALYAVICSATIEPESGTAASPIALLTALNRGNSL